MSKLTPKQARFVDEYLIDLNATQAAIRAGYSEKTANEQGSRLLVNVSISAALQKHRSKLSLRTEITQDMVLDRYWKIATADPRELISYHRNCCRHCHGTDFEFQWINEAEYIQELESSGKMEELEGAEVPDVLGGYGFNPTRPANIECPKCFGEGVTKARISDTRNLSESAALLYAGVKITKDGLEVKMHDQLKALETVARHLGMFVDKSEVKHSGSIDVTNGKLRELSEEQLRFLSSIPVDATV